MTQFVSNNPVLAMLRGLFQFRSQSNVQSSIRLLKRYAEASRLIKMIVCSTATDSWSLSIFAANALRLVKTASDALPGDIFIVVSTYSFYCL